MSEQKQCGPPGFTEDFLRGCGVSINRDVEGPHRDRIDMVWWNVAGASPLVLSAPLGICPAAAHAIQMAYYEGLSKGQEIGRAGLAAELREKLGVKTSGDPS